MAFIRLERQADTVIVTFARPPANAFDLELAREFHARLDELTANVPPAGVVITGDGRIFSGGVDFKAIPTYTVAQRAQMIGHINGAITALYGLPTATVAAVNGHAIGGAFVVMLACDARLAGDTDAKLGLTEVTAGIPYPACPIEVVQAEIEPSYRRHLVLTGEIITPRSAHAHGLIDEIVAPDALLGRAVDLARTRAAARAYARVKAQLKRDTLARMQSIIAAGSDPMFAHWV
ncbi:MAG TPA: enoyl-CoA hydratase/isomerase family protein [Candidatus Binatia bacterium]|nr:enoyl-CoA hydratase/isomerase family protein [Candidatus Binatia bacterium]